jgi:class 3 adenylate cyclase
MLSLPHFYFKHANPVTRSSLKNVSIAILKCWLLAFLALHMQQEVSQFNSELHKALALRIGIHIGPVVAQVIGKKNQL